MAARETLAELKEHIYRVSSVDATVLHLLDRLEAELTPAPVKRGKAPVVKDDEGYLAGQ